MNLFFRHGKMFDAARDDDELAFFKPNVAFFELYQQGTLDHKKQFVFGFVMMPYELALELNKFHKGVVELADDLRAPVILEGIELLGQVHFLDLCYVRHVRQSVGRAQKSVKQMDSHVEAR